MRKLKTTVVVGALMLALAAGGLAAINCTGGPCFGANDSDTLIGTDSIDNIQGLGGERYYLW